MRTIIVAPHPDDETLGAGGTLLRRKSEGAILAWVIMTSISDDTGCSEERVKQRAEEIKIISEHYNFDEVYSFNFQTTQLDAIPMGKLVSAVSGVFEIFKPNEVFMPHFADVHSDHRIVFDVVSACTKWFRYPSIKRVLSYETLSETDFNLKKNQAFRPNVFVDIEHFLNGKLQALDIYASEIGDFPFPRSHEAVRALSMFRGSSSGFKFAEAFELLLERS
jgi:LmbE family N-acetylglucosaminyl deacetylase